MGRLQGRWEIRGNGRITDRPSSVVVVDLDEKYSTLALATVPSGSKSVRRSCSPHA
jgi:hypothetical protein